MRKRTSRASGALLECAGYFILFLVITGTCGCVSPHGGPQVLYGVSSAFAPAMGVRGTDGFTFETALHIYGYSESWLYGVEVKWVYEHHWTERLHDTEAEYFLQDEKFMHNLERWTERVGRKVYDIVRLTLPSGQVRTIYFDVTNYRYWYPKGE